MDALNPDGLAIQSILPQFFGDADQPDALPAVRSWTARLFDDLDQQDGLIASGALAQLRAPFSIFFGDTDRYLNPSLAAQIARLFKNPSLRLITNASHLSEYDQPQALADLLKRSEDNQK